MPSKLFNIRKILRPRPSRYPTSILFTSFERVAEYCSKYLKIPGPGTCIIGDARSLFSLLSFQKRGSIVFRVDRTLNEDGALKRLERKKGKRKTRAFEKTRRRAKEKRNSLVAWSKRQKNNLTKLFDSDLFRSNSKPLGARSLM